MLRNVSAEEKAAHFGAKRFWRFSFWRPILEFIILAPMILGVCNLAKSFWRLPFCRLLFLQWSV